MRSSVAKRRLIFLIIPLLIFKFNFPGFEATVDELSLEEELFRRDDDCLRVLGHYLAKSPNSVWSDLQKNGYDYNMAAYKILLLKKRNRQPLRKLRRPLESVI